MLRSRSRVARSTVWIPPRVGSELEGEADRCRPLETGGVLLGFEDADDDRQIQVVDAVGPGPGGTHRRDRFEPDAAWQRDRIAAIYRDSGRVVTYLGDWHSHPLGSGRPSRLDRKTAARIARCAEARVPQPVILILSGGEESWMLHAYRYIRRRLHAAACWVENSAGGELWSSGASREA
jgi:integrative and conjugative element protein (TIGR02256 family)